MNTNALRTLILATVLSTALPLHAQQPTNAHTPRTAKVIDRFNQAFIQHDGSLLEDLIAEDCVMESVEAATDDARVVGRVANLNLWQSLANNKDGAFAVEEVVVFGDRANIRWRYRSGPGLSQSVRGVTLMRLRDGAKAGACLRLERHPGHWSSSARERCHPASPSVLTRSRGL